MTQCDHHPAYADHAWSGLVTVEENRRRADMLYSLRIDAPEIVGAVRPGQFLMLRLPAQDDPLLGRPLAVFRLDRQAGTLEVLYLVVGKMTRRLTGLRAGDRLEAWGPLGNGFPLRETKHLIMVAGGIGQTPFYTLAEQALGKAAFPWKTSEGVSREALPKVEKVSLLFGGRSADRLVGERAFRELGVEVHLATDDGSLGHHGKVTDLIKPVVGEPPVEGHLVACGPEPMLKACAHEAKRWGISCDVSLETPMACGLGICYSCVVEVFDEAGNIDYKRTCVDGPVFDAARLKW